MCNAFLASSERKGITRDLTDAALIPAAFKAAADLLMDWFSSNNTIAVQRPG